MNTFLWNSFDKVILDAALSFEAKEGVRPVIVLGKETYKKLRLDDRMYLADTVDVKDQAMKPTLFSYCVEIGYFDYGFTVTYPRQNILGES